MLLERPLVALDTSAAAEHVLPRLTALARALQQPVVLLAVIPDVGELHPVTRAHDAEVAELTVRRRQYAQEYLDGVARRLSADGVAASAVVAVGPVAETIVATAEAEHSGLIAMTTHGRMGLRRWMLGSVADRVAHLATVPVLLIRPGDEGQAVPGAVTRILLPLDGSALAEEAIPYATSLAQSLGAPVTVMRAVPMDWALSGDPAGIEPAVGAEILQAIEDEARQYVDEVVVRLRAEHVDAEAHVAPFRHAGTEIVDAAEATPGTLIVMTSRGRSGLERTVRGSVADHVIRSSAAPVLLVHSRLA